MKKILIADEIDLKGTDLLPPDKFVFTADFKISNKDILKNYKDYDILVIRSIRKIDRDFLSNAAFEVIATCSKGTDHIDVNFAKKRKIKIINAEESNVISAAEHTLALILSIYKKICFSDALVRKGKFDFYDFRRNELYGKSIGIVGFGKVGSHVGKLCNAFGMKVIANDIDKKVIEANKDFEFKNLKYILQNCDIISIHIPLNKRNINFISKKKLELLKRESVFINTSRGKVIEEDYLYSLLKGKKIMFAGLDVMQNEPKVNTKFFNLNNVILTNHIAGKTEESRRRISENIFYEINKFYK